MDLFQADTLFDLASSDTPPAASLLDELEMNGAVQPSLVSLLDG